MKFTKQSSTEVAVGPTLTVAEIEQREKALAGEAADLAEKRTQLRQAEDAELSGREADLERRREALRVARLSTEERSRIEQEGARRARIAEATTPGRKALTGLVEECKRADKQVADAIRALKQATTNREGLAAKYLQTHGNIAREIGRVGGTEFEIKEALSGLNPQPSKTRLIVGISQFGQYPSDLRQTLQQNSIQDSHETQALDSLIIMIEKVSR